MYWTWHHQFITSNQHQCFLDSWKYKKLSSILDADFFYFAACSFVYDYISVFSGFIYFLLCRGGVIACICRQLDTLTHINHKVLIHFNFVMEAIITTKNLNECAYFVCLYELLFFGCFKSSLERHRFQYYIILCLSNFVRRVWKWFEHVPRSSEHIQTGQHYVLDIPYHHQKKTKTQRKVKLFI